MDEIRRRALPEDAAAVIVENMIDDVFCFWACAVRLALRRKGEYPLAELVELGGVQMVYSTSMNTLVTFFRQVPMLVVDYATRDLCNDTELL